jgi:hypothetical protein
VKLERKEEPTEGRKREPDTDERSDRAITWDVEACSPVDQEREQKQADHGFLGVKALCEMGYRNRDNQRDAKLPGPTPTARERV